ncbi:MAG: aspartyl protease family protein, partial [Acinetobacter pittii]
MGVRSLGSLGALTLALPTIIVSIQGRMVAATIDTGATRSLMDGELARSLNLEAKPSQVVLRTAGGARLPHKGAVGATLCPAGTEGASLETMQGVVHEFLIWCDWSKFAHAECNFFGPWHACAIRAPVAQRRVPAILLPLFHRACGVVQEYFLPMDSGHGRSDSNPRGKL